MPFSLNNCKLVQTDSITLCEITVVRVRIYTYTLPWVNILLLLFLLNLLSLYAQQQSFAHVNGVLLYYRIKIVCYIISRLLCIHKDTRNGLRAPEDGDVVGGGPCQTHYFIYNGFFVSAGNDKTSYARGSFSFLCRARQTTLNLPTIRWPIKCLIQGKLSGGGGVDSRTHRTLGVVGTISVAEMCLKVVLRMIEENVYVNVYVPPFRSDFERGAYA